MNHIAARIRALLASRYSFWAVIIFFVFQSLWLVFSAHYPMAFDERFHLQSIQVYAENWPSPFLKERPSWTDSLGAVSRDGSYLFHYLMSYPYKLIGLFTDNLAATVIILRLLNVAMFTGGLLLFARVLRKAGTSPALKNTALAIFTLVPIVPYLAAHINYDNLFFLILPGLLLAAFHLIEGFKKRQIYVQTFLIFIMCCMLLGIVKLASLPLLVVIVLFMIYTAYRCFGYRLALVLAASKNNFKKLSTVTKISLAIAFIITFGLFFQRYGVNLINYGSINPSCDEVLTVEKCLDHGPFARDYYDRQSSNGFDPDPAAYMQAWLWGMWHRSFFAVAGADDNFDTKYQLPIPAFTAIVLAIFGALAVLARFGNTFRGKPFLQLLASMSLFYLAVLWLQLYTGTYSDTGSVVAVNGRYLIPVLLPLAAVMGIAISNLLRKLPAAKSYLAAAIILLFFYGGGLFTYIIRSEQNWLWQNGVVLEVNEFVRNILSLVILH